MDPDGDRMTTGRTPPRWAEPDSEVPSALRDWLQRERAAGPSDDQLRDLAARIAATLNADPNNAAADGAGASRARRASFKRIARLAGAGVAIGAAIGVGGIFHRTASRPEPGVAVSGGPHLSPVVIAAALPSAEPSPPSTPLVDPAPQVEQGPRISAHRPRRAPARPAPSGVQAEQPSDPEAELELLRRARGQLADTPQRALDTTDQHHALFRDGVFAEEREAIAIEALVRLGQHARARQRAKAFHSRYPNSAYARRLETIAPFP
jgi:hypothetical protein